MTQDLSITHGEHRGFPALLVTTPFSTAAVSLHGGQVLSFVLEGFDDALWLSPESKRPPSATRGGIPVCWPYFARQGQPDDVPQHGVVRTLPWELLGSSVEDDGTVSLRLAPPALAGESLSLQMELRIGRVLEQSLTTRNEGKAPRRFTQALHTYFQVTDALQVSVSGLESCDYLDKNDGMQRHTQVGEWNLQDPRDLGRSDRIYVDAGSGFVLADPLGKRNITLQIEGSRTLVVWNPGKEGQQAFVDLSVEGWRHFVCLEAANAGKEVIELAAGQSHVLRHRIGVSRL